MIVFPGRPEYPLSQIAHALIDLPPIDGVPIRALFGSVCRLVLHLTFSAASNHHKSFGRFTKPTSAAFRLGHYPIRRVIHSPDLSICRPSLPGLSYSRCAFGLPCGRPTADLSAVPNGVSAFHMKELRSGRAPSLRRGTVSAVGPSTPQFAGAQLCRISQRFGIHSSRRVSPRVHLLRPSDLRLARSLPMAGSRLGLSSLLHTEPLPAPHERSGDRVGHYSWTHGSLLSCDLHVAPPA